MASPSGPAPSAATGRPCSASPSVGSTRWCGASPRRCRSSPCSCAAGSSAFRIGYALGLAALLQALAALVIGGFERLPTIAVAAVALGLLESGVRFNSDSPSAAYPIMAAVIFVVLLVQRSSDSRRDNDAASTWRGAEEVRPLAAADRRNPKVQLVRVGPHRHRHRCRGRGAVRARRRLRHQGLGDLRVLDHRAVARGPHRLGGTDLARADGDRRHRCGGQRHVHIAMARRPDTGPADRRLRRRGSWRSPSVCPPCGCAACTSPSPPSRSAWPPSSGCSATASSDGSPTASRASIARRCSVGSAVDTPIRYYMYSLIVLALTYMATRGIRRSRTGRVIIAVRENERAAQSFSVPAVRAKLTAFVISGVLAGIGGALFAHLNQSFSVASYSTAESFAVFTAAVIGGLGIARRRHLGGGVPAWHPLVHPVAGVAAAVDRRRCAARAADPARRSRVRCGSPCATSWCGCWHANPAMPTRRQCR